MSGLPGDILSRKVDGAWSHPLQDGWGDECEVCGTDAVIIVQGETDSFGYEANALCAECHKKGDGPLVGQCDWCKAEEQKLEHTRDFEDEGLHGPVYRVCAECLKRRAARLAAEDVQYRDDWDDDYDDEADGFTGCMR